MSEPENAGSVFGPFLAGSIAGMIGNLVGQPWDTVKVRMQSSAAHKGGAWSHAKHLVATQGVRALYRGTVPPLLASAPTNAATFGGYELALKIMGVTKADATPMQLYFAGCAGGAGMSVVLTPLDLVKCKLQASSSRIYSGPLDCAQKVVRANGVRGLFSGFTSTFIREAPSFGIYFLGYERAFRFLNPNDESSTSLRGAAAACFAGSSRSRLLPSPGHIRLTNGGVCMRQAVLLAPRPGQAFTQLMLSKPTSRPCRSQLLRKRSRF